MCIKTYMHRHIPLAKHIVGIPLYQGILAQGEMEEIISPYVALGNTKENSISPGVSK